MERINADETPGRIVRFRNFLEKNKIFLDLLSLVIFALINIMIAFAGVQINKVSLGLYQRQMELEEKDREPHFQLQLENVWEKVEETEETDKIAKCRYTIVNNGGDITNVYLYAESYIFFYVPTGIEDEYYIFKYRTHNFWHSKQAFLGKT